MGYNHFRLSRNVDADAMALYLGDMTKMLEIDRDIANSIRLSGGLGTGKHLVMKANVTDAFSTITLSGNGRITLNSNAVIDFDKQNVQIGSLDLTSNITTLVGSTTTGDDLRFKCNTIDTYPTIKLNGNSTIDLMTKDTIKQYVDGVLMGHFKNTGGGMSWHMKESTTPTAIADFGAIYTKADNHLYFQSGAGVEYDLGGA